MIVNSIKYFVSTLRSFELALHVFSDSFDELQNSDVAACHAESSSASIITIQMYNKIKVCLIYYFMIL